MNVLSLLPSATEILFAIGADRHLVGRSHECDHPEAARSIPAVTTARINPSIPSDEIDELVRTQLQDTGTLYSLDLDLVRVLKPDVVFTQQLCTVCAVGYESVQHAMASLDNPPLIINLEPRTLDEVFASFEDVATAVSMPGAGERLAVELRRRLERIEALSRPQRVVLLEWLEPPFSAGHWMADLVTAAGGIAVLADRNDHSRELAWDRIAEADFDVLAISCCGFSVERAVDDVVTSEGLRVLLERRPSLRLIVLDGNHYFSRPGPRLVESAQHLHAALAGLEPSAGCDGVAEPYRIITAEWVRAQQPARR